MTYTTTTFALPPLDGISDEQVRVHLALYEGYVKHVNRIAEQLKGVREGTLSVDSYVVHELRRRFAFEFNGMRMHEHYFAQFEHGKTALDAKSALATYAETKYGAGGLMDHIKEVAETRGIGWIVVYFDKAADTLHTVFVSDHEVGHLAGLPVILALDLWEHAYMVDYVPAEKKKYIDAFFENLNWRIAETRLETALR